MKHTEMATLSVAELVKRKRELQATMFEAKMKNAMGQLTNPMTIRYARRDVARVNTILQAKSAAGEAVSDAKAKPAQKKK